MGWCTTADLDRFATAAGGYLTARAAENTLLLSAAHAARSGWRARGARQPPGTVGPGDPDGPDGPGGPGGATAGTARRGAAPNGVSPLFGWWEPPDGSGPRGAFLHDPTVPLLIAGRTPEMAAALAALLAKTGRPVCGVDAPVDAADAFAAAWHQRAGTTVRVHRSCRVYRLVPATAGAFESPGPSGRLRVATAADLELLAGWLAACATEAAARIGSPQDLARELIGYGGAVFWDVPQRASRLREAAQFLAGPHHREPGSHHDVAYQPVAMVVLTRPVAGTVRVSMVYTLPERRRNGYAAAVTFAASRAALDGTAPGCPAPDRQRPVTQVVLITDGSRPDRMVSRLGYQLVDERAVFRFGPPTSPQPQLKSASRPMPRLPTGPLPRLRR